MKILTNIACICIYINCIAFTACSGFIYEVRYYSFAHIGRFTEVIIVNKNILSVFFPPQVNLFFLLNIVRVLITKLKVTHQAESSLYMKAVRATLILVPLLGIQYVLIPYKPEGRVSSEIYDYIMHILMHYQVRRVFCSVKIHIKYRFFKSTSTAVHYTTLSKYIPGVYF